MLDFLIIGIRKVILKQFELSIFRRRFTFFLLSKQFHRTELLVSYRQYSHLSQWRQKRFYSLDMNLCILCTRAMSHIYGELKHYKAV